MQTGMKAIYTYTENPGGPRAKIIQITHCSNMTKKNHMNPKALSFLFNREAIVWIIRGTT